MHPERKSNRLKFYDYSNQGYYFLTINTKEKGNIFGAIQENNLILNDFGKIANQNWLAIPDHFPTIKLDMFIVMPDHIHGTKMIIPKIIQQYKSSVTREINFHYQMNFKWQKSYYDHIIRNEKSLDTIRKYIIDNPKRSQKYRDLMKANG